jgi:hypothetical protein
MYALVKAGIHKALVPNKEDLTQMLTRFKLQFLLTIPHEYAIRIPKAKGFDEAAITQVTETYMIYVADLYVVDNICDAPLSWHRVALGIEVKGDGSWACTLWFEEDWGAHKHVVFRHAEVLLNYQKYLCIDDNGRIIKIVVDRDS